MKHLITVTALTLLALALIFYSQIAAVAAIVAYALAGSLALALIGGFAFTGWYAVEKLLILKAARIEAHKQAQVLTVVENGETWVRDTNKKATWRNLTGTPVLYVNGQQTTPQDYELELYRYRLAMGQKQTRVIEGKAQLLPETTEPGPVDLLTVFTQLTQAYAIIAGQQVGKTFQARHIAAYWLKQGLRPVVIGPKWDKGEWAGCYLIGGNGDFNQVEWGINLIRKLVESRHADTSKGHKEHSIQPVFFDDWTPIVDAVPNARALVLEATTLYASVNIILYFMLHSDTANAWGVDRKGAALKDNVVKLFIVPQYDANGLVIRSQTKGIIRFAGESIERPTSLFTHPIPATIKPIVLTPNDKPQDTQETEIIAMYQQGESISGIATAVYGSKGGNQNQHVKTILARYGLV